MGTPSLGSWEPPEKGEGRDHFNTRPAGSAANPYRICTLAFCLGRALRFSCHLLDLADSPRLGACYFDLVERD